MSKEYFSLTSLIAEVINKVKDSDKEYTLYLPTNEGSETCGQYGKLIRDKALEIDKNLKRETRKKRLDLRNREEEYERELESIEKNLESRKLQIESVEEVNF